MSFPMHNIQVPCRQRSIEPVGSDVAAAPMRIFVLDVDSEIIGQLENALWVWPHILALAANVEGTVCLLYAGRGLCGAEPREFLTDRMRRSHGTSNVYWSGALGVAEYCLVNQPYPGSIAYRLEYMETLCFLAAYRDYIAYYPICGKALKFDTLRGNERTITAEFNLRGTARESLFWAHQ